MNLHPATRRRFSQIVADVLEWHGKNQRSFVWRGLKRTPYIVLVSEFMLQQTGTKQVEKMLPVFLKRFPTVRSLAKAPTADVLRAWQGLGYNRRALNLQKAAKEIAAQGRKPFPRTLEALTALPGVGAYTASAVLTFAFGQAVPVVDVNIERVLSRLWKPMLSTDAVLPMKQIYALDEDIFPHDRSADWHEALMDIGSTICSKRRPLCEKCFLLDQCKSGPEFLKRDAIHPVSNTLSAKESIYFGAPRRIWRGRILKVIAESEGVSLKALVQLLHSQFKLTHSEEFASFVIKLTDQLSSEGFIALHRNKLSLTQA